SRRRHTRFSRDWSSDVCSSDLSLLDQAKAIANDAGDKALVEERRNLGVQFNEVMRQIQTVAADTSYLGVNLIQRSAPSDINGDEIGRASCRERVYVSAGAGE